MMATKATSKHVSKRRQNNHVLGIGQDIRNAKLKSSERPLLAAIGGAIIETSITRTIDGASNLQLTVHDPARKLLKNKLLEEKWVLSIDGLHFRYKGKTKDGPDFTLNFIEENAARLQEVLGARKAYRDQVTRAEFILSQVREAKGAKIPTRIYELHKDQPIASENEKEQKKKEANETGEEHSQAEYGLTSADVGQVKVKGAGATLQQIHVIDTVLDTGMSMGMSFKVLVCAVMTITQESDDSDLNIANGPNGEGYGPFSQTAPWRAEYGGGVHGNIPACAASFFKVCDKKSKEHPEEAKGDLCQSVQNAGAGNLYSQWEDEATKTVERFLGGSDVGSIDQTVKERYAFEREKGESAWKNSLELAKEVKWRRFMVAGKFFYLPDEQLMRAKRRAVVTENESAVESIDFEDHENLEVLEATVKCRAGFWKVPPGCIVHVGQMGNASGDYLVSSITGSLFESEKDIEVKLHKPVKALKEPAPETHTNSINVPGSGATSDLAPADMPSDVVKMMVEAEQIAGDPYKWGGGHESAQVVKERLNEYDCSGAVSRILYIGGYLQEPLTSGALAEKFEAGPGEWFTIWANAEHVFIAFKTKEGWKQWEEGGQLADHAGWTTRSSAGFTARHPKGT